MKLFGLFGMLGAVAIGSYFYYNHHRNNSKKFAMFSSSEDVDLTNKSHEEILSLSQPLYETHTKIFDNVTFDEFFRCVMSTEGIVNKIRIFKFRDSVIGYTAYHVYRMEILGKPLNIVKVETGLLSEYRGKATVQIFLFKESLKLALSYFYTGIESYTYGTLVSPSSYVAAVRFFPIIYPIYSKPTPPKMQALLEAIGDRFYPKHPSLPSIRSVGWKTKLTLNQQDLFECSKDPDVQFYLGQNRDYINGYGLPTIAPITIYNIFGGGLKHLIRKSKKICCQKSLESIKQHDNIGSLLIPNESNQGYSLEKDEPSSMLHYRTLKKMSQTAAPITGVVDGKHTPTVGSCTSSDRYETVVPD